MGSKHRLLPWLAEILGELEFDTALDAFSGSGCVAYLLKTMGKRGARERLPALRARPRPARRSRTRTRHASTRRRPRGGRAPAPGALTFIEETFRGIFFADEDNRFLDRVWSNLAAAARSRAAAPSRWRRCIRACLKRQPRGVFTVAGLGRYDDGRRDLRLSLEEHFLESVAVFDDLVFDNGREHRVTCGDVFALDGPDATSTSSTSTRPTCRAPTTTATSSATTSSRACLLLAGPAEFCATRPRAQDRQAPHAVLLPARRRIAAFSRSSSASQRSTIVLSYSSNGYPDLDVARRACCAGTRRKVDVHERAHRYHFGTHGGVAPQRAAVREYLIVGA